MLKLSVVVLLLSSLFIGSAEHPPKDGVLLPIEYQSFKQGEKLKYILHFGKINAGEASFEIADSLKQIAGKDHFDINVKGISYKAFDNFYKVRDYFESFVECNSLLPTVFMRDVKEGVYGRSEYYIFDRNRNLAKSGTKTISVPAAIHDIVSVFYYLRCIDWSKQQTGTKLDLVTLLDEELMPFSIVYTGKKVISTKVGKVSCYVFKPKLVQGRIFIGQDDMTIYVSEDKNQIPVRVESSVYLGVVRADLITYSGLKFPFTAKVQ